MQYQGTGQLSGGRSTTAGSIYNAECTVYCMSLCTCQTQKLATTRGTLAALDNIYIYLVSTSLVPVDSRTLNPLPSREWVENKEAEIFLNVKGRSSCYKIPLKTIFFSTRTFCSRMESCEKSTFSQMFSERQKGVFEKATCRTSCSPGAVGLRVVLWRSKRPVIGKRFPTPA